MTENQIIMIGYIGFISLFALIIIRLIISRLKENKRILKEMEQPIEEAEAVEVGAVVVSKRADIEQRGTKMPEHRVVFHIVFSTDYGEIKEYEVDEDMYKRLDANQYGTLVTVNDNFYDFKYKTD